MDDNQSLAHITWNCKYHIVLHQSIEENYFLDKSDMKLK